MTQLKKLLVVLTPMGAAAFVAGGGTFSSLAELTDWARHPARHSAVRPAAVPRNGSLLRTKKALLAMMAIGVAAYLGLSGTWASFSAETANNNSSISSGTLTMSNTVNTGTACLSANGASQDNINAGCDAAFSITNVAPGTFTALQSAKITITNTGSIDASKLYLYAPQAVATLNGSLTSGNPVTALTITALQGTVANGDSIVVSYGGHTQTFIANASATGGATSISVTSQNANFSYPAGANVSDSSSNTTAANTNCYDAKTTVAGTAGATKGTDLNFNPIAGNPFCQAVLLYVQETTGGSNYCWTGKGSSPENANGMCTAPISVNLSATLNPGGGNITSLPVSALNGNVASGDNIVVTQGSWTQTFVASGNAFFGATSIPVNALTPNQAYTSAATVADSTSLTSLNSDTTDTISNFDTAHPVSGRIQLYPVTANGTIDTSATVQLSHYNAGTYSRTFQVGVYLPVPAGSNQNALQGLSSTFGLTWHMDQ